MSLDLKPCPFCGSEDIDPSAVVVISDGRVAVSPRCRNCDARAGFLSFSYAENVAAWNRRTPAVARQLSFSAEVRRRMDQAADDRTHEGRMEWAQLAVALAIELRGGGPYG